MTTTLKENPTTFVVGFLHFLNVYSIGIIRSIMHRFIMVLIDCAMLIKLTVMKYLAYGI